MPFNRNEKTLARPWVIPGTPGLEHRIGGLEHDSKTGNVSYDPANHEYMVRIRAEKVERVADIIPKTEIHGQHSGDLLVIGWGSTYGAIKTAVESSQKKDKKISHVHLRYLNPLPKDLGDIIKKFKKILVPEINMGQLIKVLKTKYLVPMEGFNRVQGLPLFASEIEEKIDELLEKHNGNK